MKWRAFLPYAPFLAVAAAMIAVVIFALGRIAAGPVAPLGYSQPEYPPERFVVEPGGTLVYTASLTIDRPGDIDEIERGFRNYPSATRARLCDGSFAPNVQDDPPPFPRAAVGNEVESRIVVPIHPDMAPGDYWVTTSAKKGDGGEAITEVVFRVERPCPGG